MLSVLLLPVGFKSFIFLLFWSCYKLVMFYVVLFNICPMDLGLAFGADAHFSFYFKNLLPCQAIVCCLFPIIMIFPLFFHRNDKCTWIIGFFLFEFLHLWLLRVWCDVSPRTIPRHVLATNASDGQILQLQSSRLWQLDIIKHAYVKTQTLIIHVIDRLI